LIELLPTRTETQESIIPEVVVKLLNGMDVFIPILTIPCKGNDSMLMVGNLQSVCPDTIKIINCRIKNPDKPGNFHHSQEGGIPHIRRFDLEKYPDTRELLHTLFNPEESPMNPLGVIRSQIQDVRKELLNNERLVTAFNEATDLIGIGSRVFSRSRFVALIKSDKLNDMVANCDTAKRMLDGIKESLGKSKKADSNLSRAIELIEELRNLSLIYNHLSILIGLVAEENIPFIIRNYGSRLILHVDAPFAEVDSIHFLYPRIYESLRIVHIPIDTAINVGIRGYRVSEEQMRRRTPELTRSPEINLRGVAIYRGTQDLIPANDTTIITCHIFEITDPENIQVAKYVAVPLDPTGVICHIEILQPYNLRVESII